MDKNKIKGVSLIESLVCLVIVGIGFIGVNQMISYATTSIDRSLDANKINFLSETAVAVSYTHLTLPTIPGV